MPISASLKYQELSLDLTKYTTRPDLPFPSSSDWITLGDLHGNTMKLLHLLVLNGAVQLSVADYKRFVALYLELDENPKCITQDMLAEIEGIFSRIKISPQARICLLGDVLADRGANDYLTLLLIEKLINGLGPQGALEILISNHDHKFIRQHESGRPYEEIQEFFFRSMNILTQLTEQGIVQQARIDSLFETYKTKYKLVSSEMEENGKIAAMFTHAPSNVLSLVGSALGLWYRNKNMIFDHERNCYIDSPSGPGFSVLTDLQDERLDYLLKEIIRNWDNSVSLDERLKGLEINQEQLNTLIHLLNEIFATHAHNNTLTQFVGLGLDDPIFRDPSKTKDCMRLVCGLGLKSTIYPIYTLIWSRDEPQEEITLPYQITYVNGHHPYKKNPQRITLDSSLGGKNPGAPSFHKSIQDQKALKHFQIQSSGTRSSIVIQPLQTPTPLSSDRRTGPVQSSKAEGNSLLPRAAVLFGGLGAFVAFTSRSLFMNAGEIVLKQMGGTMPFQFKVLLSLLSGVSCALLFAGLTACKPKSSYSDIGLAAATGFAVGVGLVFGYSGLAAKIAMPMVTTVVPSLILSGYYYQKHKAGDVSVATASLRAPQAGSNLDNIK